MTREANVTNVLLRHTGQVKNCSFILLKMRIMLIFLFYCIWIFYTIYIKGEAFVYLHLSDFFIASFVIYAQ